jgi:RNA polymerase sigma-70 factor, ECF subfamily
MASRLKSSNIIEYDRTMNSSKPRQNESALVCAARQGDRQALQKLLETHWRWLKGLLYSILGNPDDVDEALQSICVLILDKIGTLKDPESFKPWLAVVARNLALTQRQKRARKPVGLDELSAGTETADPQQDVVAEITRQEQHQQILQAIELLPEKYREVFVMKYMQDMTYAEIGEIMDLPLTTVQIRLVRARKMIQNRLTGKPTDKVPRT